MNIFAGNFSLKDKTTLADIDYDIMQIWEKSYFIMWADESITHIQEVIELIEQHFWPIETSNISIQWEQSLEILSSECETGTYECVSFHWPEVDFNDILERFADSMEAICVREGEISKIYGNRIIEVDFIY